jgi:tryptophan halogenase
MSKRCSRIVSFLKMHYCLSQRTEPFWQDNRLAAGIPDDLQCLLAAWRTRPPSRFDFVGDYETFPYFSYQYVLYGMGFRTEVEPEALADERTIAERAIRENAMQTERLRAGLPRHRDLIRKIVEHGLQPV